MEWFNVKGFEGYKINKDGEVLSKRGKVMKGFVMKGAKKVELKKEGKKFNRSIKSLMISNFVQETDLTQEIVNINGDINDNRLCNLELRERAKPLKLVNKEGKVFEFNSIRTASKHLQCCTKSLRSLITGKQKTCKGYKLY